VIDTHAHLDALEDVPAVLERARSAGVERVVSIGSGSESAAATRAIADANDGVWFAAGVHPHQAADGEDARAFVTADVVAVGEIGLDFFRDYAPHEAQRRVFVAQLELASELRKPVIIHCRAAEDETAELLSGFPGDVILHCFSSPALLPVALERGYYVSFAGNVTYPKAEDLREAARRIPLERLLVETDCPYLAPQPVRGKTNEPAYVAHTVDALAAVRGVDRKALAAQIDTNATTVFGLS
jgi:TatD DNase family protein